MLDSGLRLADRRQLRLFTPKHTEFTKDSPRDSAAVTFSAPSKGISKKHQRIPVTAAERLYVIHGMFRFASMP
jgi:hypothetical protein